MLRIITMLCQGCKQNHIHPGYQQYCGKCAQQCKCCGLTNYSIEIFSKALNTKDNPIHVAKMLVKNNMHSMFAMKLVCKFIQGHYPQYREVADKYLMLV